MKRVLIASLSLSLLVGGIIGCTGGGSPVDPPAALALSRGVRVGVRLVQPAPTGYLEGLDPAVRKAAEDSGVRFFPDRVEGPIVPARGYYLKIGETFYPSGPSGEFYLPNGVSIPASVPLFKQRTDAAPLGTVAISGLLRPGSETLLQAVLSLRGRRLGSPDNMDGVTRSRSWVASRKKSCCDVPGASRAINDGCNRVDCDVTTDDPRTGCCYDFDLAKGRIRGEGGDEGDDTDDNDSDEEGDEGEGSVTGFCGIKRVREFYGTECYKWTFGTGGYSAECINERAILQITGPGCWANHKYRFCQNMSPSDFNISSSGTVTITVGKTFAIQVHNRTPKNETSLSLSGDAKGTIQEDEFVTSSFVRHYSDSEQKHYVDRTVVYKAPDALPDDKTEANDTITFTSYGLTKTLTIRVVQECKDKRGRSIPCP